jgi:uncharacterized protein (DUF1015 family)
MPKIHPIPSVRYAVEAGSDVSALIAPPYDVLDEGAKDFLLARNPHNIAAVDLPHMPPKTVGPNSTYERAGDTFRQWLQRGVLRREPVPCCYIYRQTFTVADRSHRRLGVLANLPVQPLGSAPDGGGGAIFPHEQTFSEPKEDRLKLMKATRAQLSPIFGLYSDPDGDVNQIIERIADSAAPTLHGTTPNDDVLHELWSVPDQTAALSKALFGRDTFIADGHHRYNTTLNYQHELMEGGKTLPDEHPANFCMFVLVSMQDPGMVVLPTHRVLGGMKDFALDAFAKAAAGKLQIKTFDSGGLAQLEAALPGAGPHAIGLCGHDGDARKLAIATTVADDPLLSSCPQQSSAWRQLDVAIVQYLIVQQVCEPNFCPAGGRVTWKFPHGLDEVRTAVDGKQSQLGLVLQPTPLEAVRQVSEAGELMPQKSTFFYPKVATGLVLSRLDF